MADGNVGGDDDPADADVAQGDLLAADHDDARIAGDAQLVRRIKPSSSARLPGARPGRRAPCWRDSSIVQRRQATFTSALTGMLWDE